MNYKGKYICLYIGLETKAIEAEIVNGKIKVYKMQDIDTSEFCQGDTILSMEKLVKAISIELKKQFGSKKLMVISDCLGIATELISKEKVKLISKDLSNIFSFSKDKDKGMLHKEHRLGSCFLDGFESIMTLSSKVELAVSKSLCTEFKLEGFKVVSIADSLNGMLQLKDMLIHTFDENSKLVINLHKQAATVLWCSGDTPTMFKTWTFTGLESVGYQVLNFIMRDMKLYRLKSPKILLCSSVVNDYLDIVEYLKKRDYSVQTIDYFIENEMASDYSLMLGQLLQNEKSINLAISPGFLDSQKRARAKIACIAAITACGISCFMLTQNLVAYYKHTGSMTDVPEQDEIQARENILTDISLKHTTLSEIQNDIVQTIGAVGGGFNVYIASIDTKNMLPQPKIISEDMSTAEALLAAPPENADTLQEEQPAELVSKNLVIRGYSSDNKEIVRLLNALKDIASYPVLLNGIEQIPIKSTPIFAFEMEVIRDEIENQP